MVVLFMVVQVARLAYAADGLDVREITDLDLDALLAAPTVESAARRQQSLEEAPAAITVIDGKDIADAAPLTQADILRRVPGAWVSQTAARSFDVGLRGVNKVGNASVLVLLNGRRLFDPSLGYPTWTVLPINPAEIERIEVLRGPGSILYGADALTGVINIITRRPHDHVGTEAAFASGWNWTPNVPGDGYPQSRINPAASAYVAHGLRSASGKAGLRLSFGVDNPGEWGDATGGRSDTYRHGPFGYHLAVTGDYDPNPNLHIGADARHATSEAIQFVTTTLLVTQAETSAVLDVIRRNLWRERLTVRASADARRLEWRTSSLETTSTAARATAQADLRLADGAETLSLGGEGSQRNSTEFYDKRPSSTYAGVVAQSETAMFARRLMLNLGARSETIWSKDGKGTEVRYANLSPRASVIVRVGAQHTLRASAASSYRTPSPFENFVDIVIPTTGIQPPVRGVASNPSLAPEVLRSVEVGYRGRPAWWLRLDATAFVQSVKGIINCYSPTFPYQFENGPETRDAGLELGFQFRPKATLSGYLNYAYLHPLRESADPLRRLAFPRHLFSVGANYQLGARIRVQGDVHIATAVALTSAIYQNQEIVAMSLRSPVQPIVNLRVGYLLDDSRTELFALVSNGAAMARNPGDLRQFPNPVVNPIGTQLLLGLNLRTP